MLGKKRDILLRGATDFERLSGPDQDLITRGLSRGASRREMIAYLMAGGMTVAAAGSVLTAAGSALASTPKRGGRVKHASFQHGPNDTLDPIRVASVIDYLRARATYNGLVQLNDDLSVRPELAEEFSSNADNTEWTFKIRQGVEFHDGSPLTVDDVLYSMRRHQGDDSSSAVKSLVQDIREWRKIDDATVQAVLETPNSDLAVLLGTFHFKIVKDGTTDFQTANGTGPFRMEEFSPGVRSISVRNENYWRDPANLEQIEITGITDANSRLNALLSGDIDLMEQVNPRAAQTIDNTEGVELFSVPSGRYPSIICMRNQAPGDNDDFVLGMKYLQNRDRIVKSILRGQGTVGNDQPINVAYGADFCADLPLREFDPDRAKFHFEKSGVSGAEIQLADVAPGIEDICLLAQAEARKIGFTLDIKRVPSDGYWGAVWMKTPVNVASWNMRPTAALMLEIAFGPEAAWNDSQWKDERMGMLLREARVTSDPARRAEVFCEMQRLVHDNSGVIIPAHSNYLDAKSDKVQGIGRMPLGPLGGAEWPEFAWRTDV